MQAVVENKEAQVEHLSNNLNNLNDFIVPLIFNLYSTYTAVTYNQLANILHFPFRKVKLCGSLGVKLVKGLSLLLLVAS